MAEESAEKARASLERVQTFDVGTLPREAQLGEEMNFKEAVEPARRIVSLFRQFPIQFIDELSNTQLNHIAGQSDQFYQLLMQMLKLSPSQPDAYNQRQSYIQQVKNQYQPIFDVLMPVISYGATRQRDLLR
jgi:hypothetical protein